MKITEMIEILEGIRAEHGDLEVFDSECYAVDNLIVSDNEYCRVVDNMPDLFVQIPFC